MAHQVATKRKGFRLVGYTSEIINELKKVVWLKWPQEVLYLTALVLIVSIAAAILLGALDYGFTQLVDTFFLGG